MAIYYYSLFIIILPSFRNFIFDLIFHEMAKISSWIVLLLRFYFIISNIIFNIDENIFFKFIERIIKRLIPKFLILWIVGKIRISEMKMIVKVL